MFVQSRPIRWVVVLAVPVLLTPTMWVALPLASAGAPRAGALRSSVARQRQRERALSSSAARLGRLIARLGVDEAILSQRQAAAQSQLGASLAALARTRRNLHATRRHLTTLHAHLARDRQTLAAQLLAQYTAPRPDLVNVVLSSSSFSDLLDRADFAHRVAHANAQVVAAVRRARAATARESRRLAALEVGQRETAISVRRQRDALGVMDAALRARRSSLARARAARLTALRHSVRQRRRAQHELRRLEAQRAGATSTAGPGGPWAIPWAVVQCESGGQNLPPNGATASGYYQMTDPTWHALGGRTQHAYQAPKARQDQLAARLWAGGSGSGNWVCAALVKL